MSTSIVSCIAGQSRCCDYLLDARDIQNDWIVCDDCSLDVDARLVDWTLFASEPARDAGSDDAIVVTRLTYANVQAILLVA